MKTVIEMAREIIEKRGGSRIDDHDDLIAYSKELAELVRADEREKYRWDVHSCGPTCTKSACVAMREAVEVEREACAKVADYMAGRCKHPDEIADAIRARSNT